MYKKTLKPVAAAVGALMAVGMTSAVSADTNPFDMQQLDSGYMQLAGGHEKKAEGKCGAGKCGHDKKAEGKHGAGKCGHDKKAEGKCGAGKCGHEKKAEGKCGAGKCGANN